MTLCLTNSTETVEFHQWKYHCQKVKHQRCELSALLYTNHKIISQIKEFLGLYIIRYEQVNVLLVQNRYKCCIHQKCQKYSTCNEHSPIQLYAPIPALCKVRNIKQKLCGQQEMICSHDYDVTIRGRTHKSLQSYCQNMTSFSGKLQIETKILAY